MGSQKAKNKSKLEFAENYELSVEDLSAIGMIESSETQASNEETEQVSDEASLVGMRMDNEFGLNDEESGELDEISSESELENPYEIKEELTVYGKVEAILFASPKPMRTVEVHELLFDHGHSIKDIQDALDDLSEFYRNRGGGFHLKYVKRMGYQFQTTSAAKELMEKQFSTRPRPLSRASLETLSVVAYRQKAQKCGVTRAEVEFIRGVDAGSIFKTLVERDLLTCTGRKEIPGRPMMFGVTDEFLKVFQLGSINDLPALDSFQTPADVIDAAQKKIESFLDSQEGVDPNKFMDDPEYAQRLKEDQETVLDLSEFDNGTQDAEVFASAQAQLMEKNQTMTDRELSSKQHELSEQPVESINMAILAEVELANAGPELISNETLAASKVALPLNVLNQLKDHLNLSSSLEGRAYKGGLSRLSKSLESTLPDASRPDADELL